LTGNLDWAIRIKSSFVSAISHQPSALKVYTMSEQQIVELGARPSREKAWNFHFEQGDEKQIRFFNGEEVNYYQLFGLSVQLSINLSLTRDLFLDLTRIFHPDFFANENEALKAESLRRSALLNNGWKTLRDDQKRAEYVIQLLGSEIRSTKNAVPPELLEEMFEIQEAGEELREARLDADGEKLAAAEKIVKPLREQVLNSRGSLLKSLSQQFTDFDRVIIEQDLDSVIVQDVLKKIRVVLDQMNYLRTVLRNLK
jgi:molecular chaperone HscB